MQVTQVFSVRLAILTLAMPIFYCLAWSRLSMDWCNEICADGAGDERVPLSITMRRRRHYLWLS